MQVSAATSEQYTAAAWLLTPAEASTSLLNVQLPHKHARSAKHAVASGATTLWNMNLKCTKQVNRKFQNLFALCLLYFKVLLVFETLMT